MPARSNNFQSLIKLLYEMTSPYGARVTESAMMKERSGKADREVDILVEHEVAGHAIRIAIECRSRSRRESIEWIDGLIGKFRDLPVDKIVAISSSGFSNEAIAKAYANNIETPTLKDAMNVDWAKPFACNHIDAMTHCHELMLLAGYRDRKESTFSRINDSGAWEHRCHLSEKMFGSIYKLFMDTWADQAASTIRDRISLNWKAFFNDPTPRWCEFKIFNAAFAFDVPDEGIIAYDKFIFGIGTKFSFEEVDMRNYAFNGMVVSQGRFKTLLPSQPTFTLVTDRTGTFRGMSLG